MTTRNPVEEHLQLASGEYASAARVLGQAEADRDACAGHWSRLHAAAQVAAQRAESPELAFAQYPKATALELEAAATDARRAAFDAKVKLLAAEQAVTRAREALDAAAPAARELVARARESTEREAIAQGIEERAARVRDPQS